ncbi:MAG: hypothetical protein N3B12_00600 [Armatimonadetes bacterium]|nr:hypothetical protein [Armatimonadota bacterium]
MKFKTSGTYVDSSGGQHTWSVNEAHTLIWDGRPYVPVGVVFTSRYISVGASDDNYYADIKSLDLLKSKGITDIILRASQPASMTDPTAWQKIIDYLDSNGFVYGIELGDGPKDPLKGYLISPSRYRLEGPYPDTRIVCNWPDVDSAIYVVARKVDNSIQAVGGAVVKDGKVAITLSNPLKSGEVLIVYPRKSFKPIAEGGVGDIWSGFGEYRDRLINFLRKIKFGPGLRFFIEPFTSKMDFTGEMVGFVPDSQGFRVGLEAYLTKKHVHEGAVNAAWGFSDLIDTIEQAARLIPLWSQGRGLTYAYDRASAKLYSIDSTASRLWRDIIDYRDSSAQECMNTIADTIRKQIANVPVIFKSSKHHRIYANPYGMGGYDGLAAVVSGNTLFRVPSVSGKTDDAVEIVGQVYSLTEESAKTTWFILAGGSPYLPSSRDGAKTDASSNPQDGIKLEVAFSATLDLFREIGCKGFFVEAPLAFHSSVPSLNLSDTGQEGAIGMSCLDWLISFKQKLSLASLADFKPNLVNYPLTPLVGGRVKRLGPGTWWLPTLRVGSTTYIGDGLCAYSLLGEDKTYMWSSIGPKTLTFKAGPIGFPNVEFPVGSSISKKKNGLFSIVLTDVPVVLKGLDINLVFPYETANVEIERLAAAVVQADKAGLDVKTARAGLENARTVIKKGSPLIAYGMAQQYLQEVLTALGVIDVWIEGEQSQANNFDGIFPFAGASNRLALVLDTDEEPPLSPYTASFVFDAPSNSSYEVWLAATPPSECSAVTYNIDDTGWLKVAADTSGVQTYADGLAWYRIGTVNLIPGRHTIKFRADSRRASDNRYYFAIDALVLSPRGFQPKGVFKPF